MIEKVANQFLVPALFFLLGAGWLLVVGFGPGGFTVVIEAFLLASMIVKYRLHRRRLFLSGVLLLFVMLQGWLASRLPGFHWEDFVRATKPWIYLSLFVCVSGSAIALRAKWLKAILVLFVVGYIVSRLRGVERPILVVENNFEIPFLVAAWSLLVIRSKVNLWSSWTLSVLLVVGLSSSRSGAACFAAVFGLLVLRASSGEGEGFFSWRKGLRYVWLAPVVLIALWLVFERRAGDISSIDRLRFFETYLQSMARLDPINLLFGVGALARVPPQYCAELSFYLDALAGKFGQCYSVIWHASAMRLSYDFGVVGFLAVYCLIYSVLRRKYSRYDAIIGIAPLFLAGLSVGGVYNFFSFLGLFIYYACGTPNLTGVLHRPARAQFQSC